MSQECVYICRVRPTYCRNRGYPTRFSPEQFELYIQKVADTQFQEDLRLWEAGVNYETRRKIKIGGPTHKSLSNKFTLYKAIQSIIESIGESAYNDETLRIRHEIDTHNAEAKAKQIEWEELGPRFGRLRSWYEFVEFDGQRYNFTPKIDNHNVHRENDCFGNMQIHRKEEHECRNCAGRSSFYSPHCSCSSLTVWMCDKCDFEEYM